LKSNNIPSGPRWVGEAAGGGYAPFSGGALAVTVAGAVLPAEVWLVGVAEFSGGASDAATKSIFGYPEWVGRDSDQPTSKSGRKEALRAATSRCKNAVALDNPFRQLNFPVSWKGAARSRLNGASLVFMDRPTVERLS
jgi:hypothetical protein